MRSRRRSRGYRFQSRKNAKANFTPVAVILCLSVGCGYATAKYVVDPVVNYVPDTGTQQTATAAEGLEPTTVVADDINVQETGKISGYALQFGCYSSQAAAEAFMATLGMKGLQIIEQNDMYKIIGETYQTKDDAKKALAELPETAGAFVTTLYE